MTLRVLAGVALAFAIAGVAWMVGSLSSSGVAAAVVVGSLAVTAGWSWGALLIWFFVISSALTHWREESKSRRTQGIVEKGGRRDAVQVLANGALFALAGAIGVWNGSTAWQAIGLGSLATAAADTFATEVGTALHGTPRLILGGARVAAGTSGAVSAVGTLASIVGAAAIGGAALLAGWPRLVAVTVTAGGVIGAMADTVLGATVQERRRCGRCNQATERRVHDCGTATYRVAGIVGFRNDLVNLASGALGGGTAAALWRGLQ